MFPAVLRVNVIRHVSSAPPAALHSTVWLSQCAAFRTVPSLFSHRVVLVCIVCLRFYPAETSPSLSLLCRSLPPIVELIAWTSGAPASVFLRDADYIYFRHRVFFSCQRLAAASSRWGSVFFESAERKTWQRTAGGINAESTNQWRQPLDGSLVSGSCLVKHRLMLQYCDVPLCCHFVPGSILGIRSEGSIHPVTVQ